MHTNATLVHLKIVTPNPLSVIQTFKFVSLRADMVWGKMVTLALGNLIFFSNKTPQIVI
jgi:hypothetical protein